MSQPPHSPVPTSAVSLLVESDERPGQVLLGVRSATPTSQRHPDVLSTPTMRIPGSVLTAVLAEHLSVPAELPQVGEIQEFDACEAATFGGAQALATGVSYLVETTLARKIGVADPLVYGELYGEAAPVALAVDVVPDPATERSELTHMVTVRTRVEAGIDKIPKRTPSYSELLWVPAADLPDALQDRDPLRIAPHLDLGVCIHGLCVRSAARLAATLDRADE